jgi:hypothetical protein
MKDGWRLIDAYIRERRDGGGRPRLVRPLADGLLSRRGGQPPDQGMVGGTTRRRGARLSRRCGRPCLARHGGTFRFRRTRGTIDWPTRYACMRYHCLLHVVNAVARRRFGVGHRRADRAGSLTSGSQRHGLHARRSPAFEAEVNAVAREGRRVTAVVERADALDARPELVRTLTVRPPVVDGTVRIVRRRVPGADAGHSRPLHARNRRSAGDEIRESGNTTSGSTGIRGRRPSS